MHKYILTRSCHFTFLLLVLISSADLFAQDSLKLDTQVISCTCMKEAIDPTCAVTDSSGRKVLETGHFMAFTEKTIIKGSCWDYINAVYNRAGFNKKVIFRSKKNGPYADPSLVKPGDWIYHINYSFNNIDHSAIFVCWKDRSKKIAITLSYAGQGKSTPGKYGEYNLKSIFGIFRPEPALSQPLKEDSGKK